MLFVVIFTDKVRAGEVRAATLESHIEWLERNQAAIPVGGSLQHEPNEIPKGGLWIADAQSKEQLDELLKTDPFYAAGLRESYEILYWSKANANRMVLI